MPRTFLGEDLDHLKNLWQRPQALPSGELLPEIFESRVSDELAKILWERLSLLPNFSELQIVQLGSWARGELCPNSDIDMILLGDEKLVQIFSEAAAEKGMRLRYRVPQDSQDWTVGVKEPDCLSLLEAKGATPDSQKKLNQQQDLLKKRLSASLGRDLFRFLRKDRYVRKEKYDSITHFLEPHLKQGPGGMRDLHQTSLLMKIFSKKYAHEEHILSLTSYYQKFWLCLRQYLNLHNHGDILSSAAQFDLARALGFANQKDFMRQVHKGLARVDFYGDWVFAAAGTSSQRLDQLQSKKYFTLTALANSLELDSGVLQQKVVRLQMDALPAFNIKSHQPQKILWKAIHPGRNENFLLSIFRSRLIDKLLPEMIPLIGYTQHDQYHRYTTDTHILQALRWLKRFCKNPKVVLGRPLALSDLDRKTLAWAVLFHDLGKGSGGLNHEDLSSELARRYLKGFVNPATLQEVRWLIDNHLQLSMAAFRKNPQDPLVLHDLLQRGIKGARLKRLFAFTIIDILGTNPEALNKWKLELLWNLFENLGRKDLQHTAELLHALRRKKFSNPELASDLDVFLIQKIGTTKIAKDLMGLRSAQSPYQVFRDLRGGIWVRFFTRIDEPGVLARCLNELFHMGLSVQHASINSLSGIGVYNWFKVSGRKGLRSVEREIATLELGPLPQIQFNSIELISESDDEWIISLQGADQPGMLAVASQKIAELGYSILKARVHTWGGQVDDLFHLKPKGNAKDLLASLQELK